tara:strand:+ start:225 stop:488 length:264 start_codon:yes stop_codon:yes gene_type:complete
MSWEKILKDAEEGGKGWQNTYYEKDAEEGETELRLKMERRGIDESAIHESIMRVKAQVIDGKIKFSEKKVFLMVEKIYQIRIKQLFG